MLRRITLLTLFVLSMKLVLTPGWGCIDRLFSPLRPVRLLLEIQQES
jgi:hypothetical protein